MYLENVRLDILDDGGAFVAHLVEEGLCVAVLGWRWLTGCGGGGDQFALDTRRQLADAHRRRRRRRPLTQQLERLLQTRRVVLAEQSHEAADVQALIAHCRTRLFSCCYQILKLHLWCLFFYISILVVDTYRLRPRSASHPTPHTARAPTLAFAFAPCATCR